MKDLIQSDEFWKKERRKIFLQELYQIAKLYNYDTCPFCKQV